MSERPDQPRRRNPLPRAFRLKRQRLIRPLFDRRRPDVHAVRLGPLVVRARLASLEEVGQEVPLQIGFATGRQLGSAATRNRIKRVLRETFRLHQHALVDLFATRPDVLTLMVLYRGRADGAEAQIRRTLPEALRRVAAHYASTD